MYRYYQDRISTAEECVCIEETGEVFGGDVLMQAGLLVAPLWGDYRSRLIHLKEV